ncbi:MAG: hypothetical protein KZQ82_00625 [Candidatus Thiodiazotropha sp. (ex Lucinoma annulata)]|nr:hypothetical protein [Candidatus Thiodiazotropha sp. (ex Lucinoma annulata)]
MNNRSLLLFTVLLSVFALPQTHAATINLQNAGFEIPYLEDNMGTFSITGWNVTNINSSDSGFGTHIENPYFSSFYSNQIEGRNVLTANRGEIVSQSISDLLESNSTYTLSVNIGSRGYSLDTWNGYRVQLWADETLLAEDDTSLVPQERSFLTSVLMYTSSDSSEGLGGNLEVRLQSYSSVDVVFDNVSLEVTPVPIPASIYLFMTGVIGLLFRVRRENNN